MTKDRSSTESIARRELTRPDNERRLRSLEQALIAAAKRPEIKLSLTEVKQKGLLAALSSLAGQS
jgi:hypothetical protein